MSDNIFAGDLVPSVSIQNMLNQRAAVLERLEMLFEQISETVAMAHRANIGLPDFCLTTGYSRQVDWRITGSYASERPKLLEAMRKHIDLGAWRYLMNESGLRSLMDAKARKDWDEALESGKFPELTRENIEATFQTLHASRGEMFERGVINVFKSLSWDYKTNQPAKFGKRIVVTYLLDSAYRAKQYRHFASFNHRMTDQLDDVIRVFSIMDGKPEPDHRASIRGLLFAAKEAGQSSAEHEYFSVKWFLNGNGHLTIKRPDLVDAMNNILAKHFPGALPHDRHAA